MKSTFLTRRDQCYSTGRRMATLNDGQSVKAWKLLALRVEVMGDLDVPKFVDLIAAIRQSTISGKQ